MILDLKEKLKPGDLKSSEEPQSWEIKILFCSSGCRF